MNNPLGQLAPLPIVSKVCPDDYRGLNDKRLLKDENCPIGTLYVQMDEDCVSVIARFCLVGRRDDKEVWEEFK